MLFFGESKWTERIKCVSQRYNTFIFEQLSEIWLRLSLLWFWRLILQASDLMGCFCSWCSYNAWFNASEQVKIKGGGNSVCPPQDNNSWIWKAGTWFKASDWLLWSVFWGAGSWIERCHLDEYWLHYISCGAVVPTVFTVGICHNME